MDEKAEKKLIRQQQARERSRDMEIDEAIKALLQHRQGRRLMYWLISLGAPGRQPFTGNALTTAFACGELNVAQRIQARVMSANAAQFLAMLKEQEDERLDDAITDTSDAGTDED